LSEAINEITEQITKKDISIENEILILEWAQLNLLNMEIRFTI
jgi:hypothetical protein